MSLQGLLHLNMAPMTFRIPKTFSIGCLPLVSQLPIGPDLSVYCCLHTYLRHLTLVGPNLTIRCSLASYAQVHSQ